MLKRLARLVLQRHFHHKRGKQSGSPMRGKDVFLALALYAQIGLWIGIGIGSYITGRKKKIPMRKCLSLPACCWSSSATAAYFKASTQHLADLGEENLLLLLVVKFFFSDAKCSKCKNNNNKKNWHVAKQIQYHGQKPWIVQDVKIFGILGWKGRHTKGKLSGKKKKDFSWIYQMALWFICTHA